MGVKYLRSLIKDYSITLNTGNSDQPTVMFTPEEVKPYYDFVVDDAADPRYNKFIIDNYIKAGILTPIYEPIAPTKIVGSSSNVISIISQASGIAAVMGASSSNITVLSSSVGNVQPVFSGTSSSTITVLSQAVGSHSPTPLGSDNPELIFIQSSGNII